MRKKRQKFSYALEIQLTYYADKSDDLRHSDDFLAVTPKA